jgi:hypothetical protein
MEPDFPSKCSVEAILRVTLKPRTMAALFQKDKAKVSYDTGEGLFNPFGGMGVVVTVNYNYGALNSFTEPQ